MHIRTCHLESHKLFLFQAFLKIQSKPGTLIQTVFHYLNFRIRLSLYTHISLACRFCRRTGIRQFGSKQHIVRVKIAITYTTTIRTFTTLPYIMPLFITGKSGHILKIISNRFLRISGKTMIIPISPKRELGFRMIQFQIGKPIPIRGHC